MKRKNMEYRKTERRLSALERLKKNLKTANDAGIARMEREMKTLEERVGTASVA